MLADEAEDFIEEELPAAPQGADWRSAKAAAAKPAEKRVCAATTKKGDPCASYPLAGRQYCPRHMHLEKQ